MDEERRQLIILCCRIVCHYVVGVPLNAFEKNEKKKNSNNTLLLHQEFQSELKSAFDLT